MIALIIAVIVTVGLGIALLLILITGHSPVAARLAQVTAAPVVTRVEEPETKNAAAVLGSISSVLQPIRRLVGLRDDADVARRLSLAGYSNPGAVDLFYATKLLGPVLGGVIAGFFLQDNVVMAFIMLAAVGFFAPDFWLSHAVSKRREEIRLALPDAVDLLVICMEAGLGMDQALIRVGEELRITHRALSEELLLINLEQRAGKPRVEAWRHFAERVDLEVVRSFVAMLVQTERFGTPLSRSLGQFADALRVKRRQKAEEMAAKTTIKLLFPLAFFIFPSLFIVLLGPAIIAITKSFSQAFQ